MLIMKAARAPGATLSAAKRCLIFGSPEVLSLPCCDRSNTFRATGSGFCRIWGVYCVEL